MKAFNLLKDVYARIIASKVKFAVSLLVSFAIFYVFSGVVQTGETGIDIPAAASGISLFSGVFYFIYKYYILTAVLDSDKIRKGSKWKYVKSFFGLTAILAVYAMVMTAAVSICTAYIPELTAWTAELFSGNTDSFDAFVAQLEHASVINALMSLTILIVILAYGYFGLITSAALFARTNRFVFSLFAPFGFINRNLSSYLVVCLPLLVLSLFCVYFFYDFSWLLTVFYVYAFSVMFDKTFNIDDKKHSK